MASSELYRWLRKKPQPVKLRCLDADGREKMIAITSGQRNGWITAEESIKACKAVTVEALDDKDVVIRAIDFEVVDESPDEAESKDAKAESRAMTGQAAMLKAYGVEIREAYRAGADGSQSAIDALVKVVDTLGERFAEAISNMNALAVQNVRTMQDAAEAAADAANPNKDENAAMITTLIQAGMQGLANKPAQTPAPNGKKGS